MLQDALFGLRLLWKEKGFSAAAILTVALCIGANTSIFTVLDQVVFRPLPFPAADRLVILYNKYPGVGVERGGAAAPDFSDRRKLTDVFSEVALFGGKGFDAGPPGATERIRGQEVTPSFFTVLGVRAVHGRAFLEEEGQPGNDAVAVLSEGLWRQMYAGDAGILGKEIRLSGRPHKIVGVVPDHAALDSRDVRLWVPLSFTPQQLSDDSRHNNSWEMIARLQPGVPLERAQKRIDALNAEIAERFPKYKALLEKARFATAVVGARDELVREIRPTLFLLQSAVLVVLAIGCVNLANLMLVRASVRMKELAIRHSLGAGRLRIARQLLMESLVVACGGAFLGVALAFGGVRLLYSLGAAQLPRAGSIAIDVRVLGMAALAAVLTGIVFGSVPVFHFFRQDLNAVFRGNERGGTAGRHALSIRSVLVAGQVSLAFVLLIGAGLLTLTFYRLLNVQPGFDGSRVLTAQFSLPATRYPDDASRRAFLARLRDALRNTPGITHAGTTTYLPFGGHRNSSLTTIVGRQLGPGDLPPVPGYNSIDAGYLPAMSIPILRGRNIADADSDTAPKVCLIDEYLARKYWPGGDPIGAQLRPGDPTDTTAPAYTIVGVTGNVKVADLGDPNAMGTVYFSNQQMAGRDFFLAVKAAGDSGTALAAIRRLIGAADPELAVFDTRRMPERITASLVRERAAMTLCLVFGILALILAAVGIYGVLAYSVTQRTREIGIRSALGATRSDILRMIVRQGVTVAASGLIAGSLAAFAVTRWMVSLLYGVQPADPVVFASVAAILGAVALIASVIPARRAMRIQPSTALRHE